MDYLQYACFKINTISLLCFKPYYKWITFNTLLVACGVSVPESFKPYYKWITFNTSTLFR